MGLAFAFGWVPCIGPILGMILSLAAQESTVTRGVMLMAVYAIGLGLPFLLAAIFLNRALGQMTRMRKHMGTIEKVMGGLLIVVGLMLLTGLFTKPSPSGFSRFFRHLAPSADSPPDLAYCPCNGSAEAA